MQNKINIKDVILLPFTLIILIKDIIVNSLIVAYKIICLKKINSYITTIDCDKSEMITSLKANAITLTPGSIAIDIDHHKIIIHNFDR